MICSMTGYGRAELAENEKKITAEIKSVNHKYMDVNIKMPRKLNMFDPQIRKLLSGYATRGKIDLYISYEDFGTGAQSVRYNSALAAEYYDAYVKIRNQFAEKKFGIFDDTSVSSIARCPDVLVEEEENAAEDEVWEDLRKVLEQAFRMFRDARIKEGGALKENILEKLDEMDGHVQFVEDRIPEIIAQYTEKLKARIQALIDDSQVDEARIAAEVTIYADKTAIDEELVRLKTHIKHMRDILLKGGDSGRNLDFVAQEMNREANTILSKSNDIEITNRGIELKTCIEKIREQVQNIE